MQIKQLFFIILIIIITITCPITRQHHKEFILILDPAGDAKKTGRAIDNSFERGLTLQCAEKIKSLLETRIPYLKIIISRLPGDHIYELQNASMANRIHADLFINLHFYYTQETKPTIFLYQFSYGNDFAQYKNGLTFNTYDQAYKINKSITDELTQLCAKYLKQPEYMSFFSLSGPYALPIKPLIGIISPSISIEIGLKNKDAWQHFVEPLVNSIIEMIKHLDNE